MRIVLILFFMVSCSHSVHLVNFSDFETKNFNKAKEISAMGEQKVIFWFTYDTNFVEKARDRLIAQCPKGKITNIVSRYSTSHGFFSWTNKLFMRAKCLN